MRHKKGNLLLIEWVDSHSGRGWHSLEDLERAAEPLLCRSVGWLALENDKCMVIVPHVSSEKNGNTALQYGGDITIPKKAIIKISVVKAG
jgi:hypothetical protein